MIKKKLLSVIIPLVIFGLVYSGCKKDDDDDGSSTMTATIEGSSWSATSFAFNISGNNTSIVGWKDNEYVSITLVDATTTGNYDVGISNPSTGAYSNDGQSTFYVSRQGYVNVTEYTDLRIKGTFEFLAVKATTQDTVLVDNGAFDVSTKE
ncbi:MAG: hypothetical protein AMS27_01285 [Bacteroides sp. SM23_62_1]|nr:MAG: hypothetical protein AMS27_01285 [Bacteroides sp. SM23_62_1]